MLDRCALASLSPLPSDVLGRPTAGRKQLCLWLFSAPLRSRARLVLMMLRWFGPCLSTLWCKSPELWLRCSRQDFIFFPKKSYAKSYFLGTGSSEALVCIAVTHRLVLRLWVPCLIPGHVRTSSWCSIRSVSRGPLRCPGTVWSRLGMQ